MKIVCADIHDYAIIWLPYFTSLVKAKFIVCRRCILKLVQFEVYPLTCFGLNRFQAAIKKYGVPEEEIFQTADLFERRNINQVALCLFSLGRIVSMHTQGKTI